MELETRNQIVTENLRLVEKLAKVKKKMVASPQVSYEDLVSAGYPALIEAADHYEQEKGPFETFASKRIKGAMSECVHDILRWGRRNTNRKTCKSGKSIPDGMSISSLDDLPPDYYDSSLVYYDGGDLFDSITQPLSELGRKVLRWYFVDGLTYKQIGEKLGVVESRVAQKVRKYKDQLRATYRT